MLTRAAGRLSTPVFQLRFRILEVCGEQRLDDRLCALRSRRFRGLPT
jgi:hypothetical protein